MAQSRRSGPRPLTLLTVTAPVAAHDACEVGNCVSNGVGVFARRDLGVGEYVLTFRGERLRRDQITDFTYCLEIGNGLFLGPSGDIDDFVNHSCSPNCGVYVEGEDMVLRAIRVIHASTELTFDYSTVMQHDPTSFVCHCGTKTCRRVVGTFGSLPLPVRRRYLRLKCVPLFAQQSLFVGREELLKAVSDGIANIE
jgi:uncharacterized protein